MKKIIGIALVLALALGIVAFAETAADPVPAVTEETATAPEAASTAPAASAEVSKVEDEDAELKEAMEAFHSAKQQKAVTDLEDELNGYVEEGTMTREQADLILNNVKEKMAEKNGQCPNCGYQFQGKGSMMGGQKHASQMGGHMPGGMQRGQMNGRQQWPDAQSGATAQMPGSHMSQQTRMNGQM